MPHFRLLSEELRWDLVEYVRFLAIRGRFEELMLELSIADEEVADPDEVADIVVESWAEQALKAVHPPVREVDFTPDSVARGRAVYLDTTGANCVACHGESGRGDGPSATAFADGWGYPIVPRDLTSGVYRAGDSPADLYRSIATGINGTPMPAFEGSISPEDIWSMVHFLKSLRPSS
jgi:mono/diheme cytochrome c family protein